MKRLIWHQMGATLNFDEVMAQSFADVTNPKQLQKMRERTAVDLELFLEQLLLSEVQLDSLEIICSDADRSVPRD